MNILLILLGCSVSNLLNNRINTAINFVDRFNGTNISWFLSGGIKNINEDTVTEAEKMARQISKFEKKFVSKLRGNKWNYVFDTVATNTAENFIMAKNFLDENNNNNKYDEVFIITSAFHYERANKIANKILDKIEVNWILGNEQLHDSYYWEGIHIKNVDSDVSKAILKFKK